jgi:hypothetical protein
MARAKDLGFKAQALLAQAQARGQPAPPTLPCARCEARYDMPRPTVDKGRRNIQLQRFELATPAEPFRNPSPPPPHHNNRLESGAWKRLDTSLALVGARRQISPALSKGGLLGLDEPEARSVLLG